MSRRGSVVLRLLVAVLCAPCAAKAQGKPVLLQIKPHPGDTLHLRLDQQTEMTGTRRLGASASSAWVVTSMQMFSRAIVEDADHGATTVLAVTDSVLLSTTDEHARGAMARAQQQLRGQRVHFHVMPDGLVTMGDDDGATPREISQVVSVMPAAFPGTPVRVGATWTRDVPLPAGTQFGAALTGKLHVSFRLDSLGRGGDLAYVSMRGELRPGSVGSPDGGLTSDKGSVSGTMLVDRRRGWLTDSRFNIVVNSTVAPPVAAGAAVMHMQLRVMQHMRTTDKR